MATAPRRFHHLQPRSPDRVLVISDVDDEGTASGEPIDPSPTIDQAVNGGFPWLEIQCARCKTPSDVDLAAMKHPPPTTFVHDLASRLRCRKCAKAGRRPAATLLQLAWQPRHPEPKSERCAICTRSPPTRRPSLRCFAS